MKGGGFLHRAFDRIKFKWNFWVGELTWWVMTKSIRYWVDHHMDQWEMVKFRSEYGNVTYVTISYYSDYPDAFVDLDHPFGFDLTE